MDRSSKKKKALPAQSDRTDRARREASSVPAGLSSSSDDGRKVACPAGATFYSATAKKAEGREKEGVTPSFRGSRKGGRSPSTLTADDLRREEIMEELSIYEKVGEVDTGVSEYDLFHMVHETSLDLTDLVKYLVPQRGRLYRLFAGMTRTLDGALAELQRRRAIIGVGVVTTTADDRVFAALQAKETLSKRVHVLEKELAATKEELTSAKEELTAAKEELMAAKEALVAAKETLAAAPRGVDTEVRTGGVPVLSAQAEKRPSPGLDLPDRVLETVFASLADYVDLRVGAEFSRGVSLWCPARRPQCRGKEPSSG